MSGRTCDKIMLFIPLNVDGGVPGVDGLLLFLSDKRAGTPPSTKETAPKRVELIVV